MSFSELGLNPDFAAKIQAAGYENPTELQKQLIPLMTAAKSVIVWTQSASGKTGAFLIPAINYILSNPLEDHRHARILILTSRRDRVNQINYTIKRLLGDDQQLRSGFIVSGRPYQPQMRLLRRPLDLMIATPGRLNDLVDNNKADFSKLEMLIIDDLSAIYHKGLHGLVNKILSERTTPCPTITFVRQEEEIATYARAIFAGAQELEVEDDRNPLLQIPQVVHLADDYTHKIALMDHLLDEFSGEPTSIFTTNTKTAKALAESLANHGHSAEVFTDLSEEERTDRSTCPILIYADQDGLKPVMQPEEHVINFELPIKVEDYEARLQGIQADTREEAVIIIVLPRERENLKRVEDFLGDSIEQCTLPGLAPLHHTSGFTLSVRSPRNKGEQGQQRKGGNNQGQNKGRHGGQTGRNANPGNHVTMVTVAIVVGSNTPKHPLKVSIVRMTNQQMHNGSSAKALMDASMGVRNANAVMAAITVHPQVICHDVIRVVLMKSVAGKSSRITPVLPPQIKVKVTKKLLSVTKKSVVF